MCGTLVNNMYRMLVTEKSQDVYHFCAYQHNEGNDPWMKKLYRSSTQRMVAGVLGGLAEYFNVDPTILRLAFVVLFFISFFTVSLIYLAAAIIIPDERDVY